MIAFLLLFLEQSYIVIIAFDESKHYNFYIVNQSPVAHPRKNMRKSLKVTNTTPNPKVYKNNTIRY